MVLRELRDGDEVELLRIHRTPEVARWWGQPDDGFPWSDDPDCERLAIVLDGRVAGMIQFEEELTPRYRHASIDLFLDPRVHGRGLGPQAVDRVLRQLIDERGHHRVTIDPAVANTGRDPRVREGLAFGPVGVMRRYERDAGGPDWHDALLMELIAGEERRDEA